MKRLMEKTVFVGVGDRLALGDGADEALAATAVNATTDGVVRPPSAFSITVGSPPSRTAMHEFVVPRSMPMVLAMMLGSSLGQLNKISVKVAEILARGERWANQHLGGLFRSSTRREPGPMRPHLAVLAGVALALAGAAPATAAPVPIYGGHTSQDAPIALRTSADGRRLTQLLFYADFKCDDGTGDSWFGSADFAAFKPPTIDAGTNIFSPARVGRGGTFRATGEEPFNGGKLTETLRGSLRRGVAHGTFSATFEATDDTTGAKVTCNSGTLRWAARSAPGRIYAGLTSNEGPVVIQRSRDGRHVDSMWLGWDAPCQSGLFFGFGDHFVRFPVSRAGRFGNAFDDPFTLDGGGHADLRVPAPWAGGYQSRLRHLPRDRHRQGRGRRHHRRLRQHAAALDRELHEGQAAQGAADRHQTGRRVELPAVGAHPEQRALAAGRPLRVTRAAAVPQQVDVQLDLAAGGVSAQHLVVELLERRARAERPRRVPTRETCVSTGRRASRTRTGARTPRSCGPRRAAR